MTDQARQPAGSPEGGQFTSVSGLEHTAALGDIGADYVPSPADRVFDTAAELTCDQARQLAGWGSHLDEFTEWDDTGLHVHVPTGQDAAEDDPSWRDFYGDVESVADWKVGVHATGVWDDPTRVEQRAKEALVAAAIAAASRDRMDQATYAKLTAPYRTVFGPIHDRDIDVRGNTIDAAVFRHILAGNPMPSGSADPDGSLLTQWLVDANSAGVGASSVGASQHPGPSSATAVEDIKASTDAAVSAADDQYDRRTDSAKWQDVADRVRQLHFAVERGGYREEHPAR